MNMSGKIVAGMIGKYFTPWQKPYKTINSF